MHDDFMTWDLLKAFNGCIASISSMRLPQLLAMLHFTMP
jgi:hypothetical protein